MVSPKTPEPGRMDTFMKRALTLAARGSGTTHPNPMVGAVIVAGDRIVGEGWHRAPGQAHAESVALEKAGSEARGGTLFVTLEPCNHTGRTPPCTKAIIDAGIAHVSAACTDPNPLVNGRGFEALRRAGVSVTTGSMEKEAVELNRAFFHFVRESTPYTTLKLATTLDGRIATHDGSSKWITGEKARRSVHRLRAQADAIMVGVGTVIADDPSLTARGVGRKIQPLKVVLDPTLRTPLRSQVVQESEGAGTLLVVGAEVSVRKASAFEDKGVELLRLPVNNGFFAWSALAEALAEKGIVHLLAEGGGNTAAWMLRESAVNRLELYLAPRVFGGAGVPAVGDLGVAPLEHYPIFSYRRIRRVGKDLQITADLK